MAQPHKVDIARRRRDCFVGQSNASEVPGKAAARRGKGRFSEVRRDDAPISISPLVADIFCCLRTISVFKGIHRYIAG
jgi:hypothetical protein